jgi:indolepyruvate decarboxylase
MYQKETTMPQPSVVEYAVQRLAKLGITDCFGLPGDYAFPINDAIASHKSVEQTFCGK